MSRPRASRSSSLLREGCRFWRGFLGDATWLCGEILRSVPNTLGATPKQVGQASPVYLCSDSGAGQARGSASFPSQSPFTLGATPGQDSSVGNGSDSLHTGAVPKTGITNFVDLQKTELLVSAWPWASRSSFHVGGMSGHTVKNSPIALGCACLWLSLVLLGAGVSGGCGPGVGASRWLVGLGVLFPFPFAKAPTRRPALFSQVSS